MIAGYLGSTDQFDNAFAQYAEAYADQAERDFEAFQGAIRSGRLSTEAEKGAGLEFWYRKTVSFWRTAYMVGRDLP